MTEGMHRGGRRVTSSTMCSKEYNIVFSTQALSSYSIECVCKHYGDRVSRGEAIAPAFTCSSFKLDSKPAENVYTPKGGIEATGRTRKQSKMVRRRPIQFELDLALCYTIDVANSQNQPPIQFNSSFQSDGVMISTRFVSRGYDPRSSSRKEFQRLPRQVNLANQHRCFTQLSKEPQRLTTNDWNNLASSVLTQVPDRWLPWSIPMTTSTQGGSSDSSIPFP
ncbi:uncharacterized protein BYT42DRAFT_73785 [Radiomyces spectabilis]|uniref:uncharacterized protein n=1 Tax=Radiomyces spectabilis TaxID=64574 RepID=UPI00221E9DF9|nr:uncharacterized protein BYT42DRAFT_73785 [Radiomyces spectabilis]KAI8371574.1 hypothetical protein BYT42DRAFT_73785 [Radiomyces spectabilis]